jgi:AcrR family transcriptional regulator
MPRPATSPRPLTPADQAPDKAPDKATHQTTDQTAERGATETAILDAAEREFAASGFHGATTRAIAEGAQANPALIQYYFGSKENLYQAVFARRSDAINGERIARLTRLQADGTPTLERVLEALLTPTIALGRDPARGGADYARLLAHVAAGTDERSQRLARERYDDTARLFIAAIAAAVPDLGRDDAVRVYLHTISIGMALMAPTGRARDLSGGAIGDDPVDLIVARAVCFVAAGIRATALRGD